MDRVGPTSGGSASSEEEGEGEGMRGNMRPRPLKRWVGAAVLTLVALIGGTASAMASVVADASPALIPPDATGSLTIHKHLGLPVDQTAYPANGTALVLPTSSAPLAGVVFTVTRVAGVDLTTNAGWYAALAYQDNLEGARAQGGTVHTLSLIHI